MAKQEKNNSWKSFVSIVNAGKNDDFARVYLITGDEKYLIDRTLKSMKKLIVSSGAESLDYYLKDLGNADLPLEEFQSLVGTPPFISKRRMTVIRNSGLFGSKAPSSSKDQDKWKAAIAAIPEFAAVFFIEEKVDKRKKQLIDAIAQNGVLVEIDIQSEDVLKTWINQRCKESGISMHADCVSSLISRVNSSMRAIDNEMNKISLYCENTGTKTVTMMLLDKLCVPDVHASVFQMTDAIGQKNVGKALDIFASLVILKEPIPKIRLMLARHIRHLICAKEIGDAQGLVARLKVHPFVAKNLVSQSKGFTMTQLEKLYKLCFQTDSWVKNGKMEDQLAMEVLLTASGKI